MENNEAPNADLLHKPEEDEVTEETTQEVEVEDKEEEEEEEKDEEEENEQAKDKDEEEEAEEEEAVEEENEEEEAEEEEAEEEETEPTNNAFPDEDEETITMIDVIEREDKSEEAFSEERLMTELGKMDRATALEAIHGYNVLKEDLSKYLRKFADGKKVVREQDIHEFFDQMRAKKRPRFDDDDEQA